MGQNAISLASSCVLSILLFSVCSFSGDAPNFTGKYALQAKKASATDPVLEVVQSVDSVEVTRHYKGERLTNRYPLGGGDGDYMSSGGIPGKCKAQIKGKQLILESVVTMRPQPQGPAMREHERERWELSADSKTLTVQTDVDFPDVRADVSAVVGESVSGKQKYVRVAN
jgi:hypothetical protein